MSPSSLEQRRTWFRFFPDGSLEFVVVTRVLALLLMVLLFVVTGILQRPVFLALCGMLWIDYLLTLFWMIDVATDLGSLCESQPVASCSRSTSRSGTFLVMALPATLAFAMVAPWPQMVVPSGFMRHVPLQWLVIGLAIAFVISLAPAYRQARRLSLGPPLWTSMILVPLLHWFGIHRLLNGLHERILQAAGQQPQSDDSGPGLSSVAADVLWAITILPWLVIALLVVLHGVGTMSSMPYRIMPMFGAMLFGLFSVVDLAAMEKVQRRFVQFIRNL